MESSRVEEHCLATDSAASVSETPAAPQEAMSKNTEVPPPPRSPERDLAPGKSKRGGGSKTAGKKKEEEEAIERRENNKEGGKRSKRGSSLTPPAFLLLAAFPLLLKLLVVTVSLRDFALGSPEGASGGGGGGRLDCCQKQGKDCSRRDVEEILHTYMVL